MKLITVMTRAENLDAIQTAVAKRDAYIAGASEILDLRAPVPSIYRAALYQSYELKMKIEVIVSDLMVKEVIDAITQAASIGDPARPGICGIFVTTLDEWVPMLSGSVQAPQELETVSGKSRQAS